MSTTGGGGPPRRGAVRNSATAASSSSAWGFTAALPIRHSALRRGCKRSSKAVHRWLKNRNHRSTDRSMTKRSCVRCGGGLQDGVSRAGKFLFSSGVWMVMVCDLCFPFFKFFSISSVTKHHRRVRLQVTRQNKHDEDGTVPIPAPPRLSFLLPWGQISPPFPPPFLLR